MSQSNLNDLFNSFESLKESADAQIEANQNQIDSLTSKQEGLHFSMDKIKEKFELDLFPKGDYLHTFGNYYNGSIDSTSNLTEWQEFQYYLNNNDSTNINDVYPGHPVGYDSTGHSCYDSANFTYAFYCTGNRTSNFILASEIAAQMTDLTSVVFATIICVNYWIKQASPLIDYTIVNVQPVSLPKRGQTTTWINSNIISVMKKVYEYHLTGWGVDTTTDQNIENIISDFNYSHDYIFHPIGLDGTYGTKDMISKLQSGQTLQQSNKTKFSDGQSKLAKYTT